LKKREAVILLGYLEEIVDGGKTSRRIAREAIEMGYMEPPITNHKVKNVSTAFKHLRKDGQVKVLNKKRGRNSVYKYTLTKSGWDYYNWLESHYREKTSQFPPEEV